MFKKRFWRKAMQRKNHKPEIKWNVQEDSIILNNAITQTESMTPQIIAPGTGRHNSIGGRVKFLRLSYEIILAMRRNADYQGVYAKYRIAILKPRVNDAGLQDQINQVMPNNDFWDYNTVDVKYDKTHVLYNPWNINNGRQSVTIKGMLRIPMNVQLNNAGGLMDDKDKIVLVVGTINTGSSIELNYRCKTSFIDN